jgi:hypothetical protein
MSDPPFDPLPPIMRNSLLRVRRMGVTNDGHPYILLTARYGHIRRLVVYLSTDRPAEWQFGYEVYDPDTRSRISYIGTHGDPDQDEIHDLEGVPGLDD